MKRFYTAFAALALFALITIPAHAGVSCYGGLTGGYSMAATDASLDVAPDALGAGSPAIPGLLTVDGLAADDWSGGVTGGCDVRMDRIVVGGWGDFTWHSAEFNAGLSLNPIAPVTAGINMAIDQQWSVGGRAGLMVTDTTLVYGLIGYTKVDSSDLNWNVNSGGASASGSFGIAELDGIVYGGGIEVDVAKNIAFGVEYRYTDLNDTNVAIIPNALNLNLDPDIHTVRGVLKLKFDVAQ